jgi:hypothetical protein
MEDDDMGQACSMYRDEGKKVFKLGNLKERDHLENLLLDGR